MKYRFLIVSENFDVYGTNDANLANKTAAWERVFDCETGKLLDQPEGFQQEVEEYKADEEKPAEAGSNLPDDYEVN